MCVYKYYKTELMNDLIQSCYNKDIVQLTNLINVVDDIDECENIFGYNPISVCCLKGWYEGFKFLVDNGANIHYINKYDNNSLFIYTGLWFDNELQSRNKIRKMLHSLNIDDVPNKFNVTCKMIIDNRKDTYNLFLFDNYL